MNKEISKVVITSLYHDRYIIKMVYILLGLCYTNKVINGKDYMSREVSRDELLKVNSALSTEQIRKFFTQTPKDKIKTRPAKGGGTWDFVAGSYVTQVLNSLFGFNWSFEVVTSMQEALATAQTGTIVVQGRLKVKIGDEWITKEQYGRKEVARKKDSDKLLDFGNDMKAAATDAKKKCASELGLFADVYSKEDFFEANVTDEKSPEDKKKELKEKLNA